MAFRGYKLKTKLYAAHSNVGGTQEDYHFHTFSIVLYLQDYDAEINYFRDVEKKIEEWLAPYQKAVLSETPLFAGKDTTLEAIGDTFYEEWYERAMALNFELVRLDIFENPVRTYSVSAKLIDGDVNEISAMPHSFADAIHVERTLLPTALAEVAVTKEPEAATEEEELFSEPVQEEAEKDKKLSTQEKQRNKDIALVVGTLFFVFAGVLMLLLYLGGNYPTGEDTFCHLYRADLLLEEIRSGNLYPLYDKMWYNGVEIMRYWAPLPLYVLALCQAIMGSVLGGYLLFVSGVFFFGALGWMLLGMRMNRIGLASFLGVLWFFLPENIHVLMMDGNLPRALIHALLPYLLSAIYGVLEEKRRKSVISVALGFTLIGFCHVGTAIIILVTLVMFLCFYGKKNRCMRQVLTVLAATVSGLLITGIWMVPSLHGSGVGSVGGGNQVMERFFRSMLVSLNPIGRMQGELLEYYYGVFILAVVVFGVIFGTKKTLPGFATGLIIFFLTTESMFPLLAKMPFSQYLWMYRFVAGSLAFVFLSMLLWKGLRRGIMVVLCMALLLDCATSYRYVYTPKENRSGTAKERIRQLGEDTGMARAKEVTTQRLAVFDLSGYGAFAPYYAAGGEDGVAYTFGAGWEGARTAENIVMLNSAVENGYYTYLFDRCIAMGADTVLFVIEKLQNGGYDIERVVETGASFGFEFVEQSKTTLLLHKEVPETFGVINEYEYLAIGRAAKDIAYLFPSFKEGEDALDAYTLEELCAYKRIFLSDFTYKNKAEAEDLLTRAANAGVEILIDMNKVPVNPKNNLQEIFGVTVQNIMFQHSFPDIYYEGEWYETRGFPKSLEQWKGNYLIGLSEVQGKSLLNGTTIPFYGTAGNDNISFIGYNFPYYAELTGDEQAIRLLEQILKVKKEELPARQIVPITIRDSKRSIVIESAYDNVTTTRADIDIFHSDTPYRVDNHLITVDAGVTEIELRYPYFVSGLLVSAAGVLALVVLMIVLKKVEQRKKKTEETREGKDKVMA